MQTRAWNLWTIMLVLAQCLIAMGSQTTAKPVSQPIDLSAVIRVCDASAAACGTEQVPQNRTITLDNHVQSLESYDWLRSGLTQMKKVNPTDRHHRAEVLLRHLREADPASASAGASRARHEADAVLADVEFAKAKPPWLQQQWERFQDWLGRHTRMPGAATSSLLRLLLEVLLFGLPMLLLGLWLLRQVREERRRPTEPGARELKERRSRVDWLEAATDFAAKQQWREAVHALYWHSIGMLEQQEVIAASHTRTPREYLSLLPAGTRQRAPLRELTQLLESTWYGNREPEEADCLRAEALAREVAAA